MRPTSTIPAWAGGYVGIGWRERGRDRAAGLDCWGLVQLVYAERYGILLPSHHDGYDGSQDRLGVAALMNGEIAKADRWARLDDHDGRVGDLVLLRIGGELGHVGVLVGTCHLLHAQYGTESCIERLDLGVWSKRRAGLARYVGPVRVLGRPRPMEPARIDVELPAGGTVAEMLAASGVNPGPFLRVFLGDVEVPRDAWSHVRPKPGRILRVTAVPAGGGQGSGKTVARIVLTIAVIAAAVYTGGAAFGAAGVFGESAFGAAAVTAGVGLAGTLLINALIPPPRPRLTDESAQGFSPTIAGGRNDLRPFGVVPVIHGRHRIVPPYGSAPYTEVVGDEQYLRCLFVPGMGPLELSDYKIGDTPIDQFEGVEIEVREGRLTDEPLRLFPGTVIENAPGVPIRHADGWIQRTSSVDANELSVDVTWPQGLARLSASGEREPLTVSIEVQYSPTGLNQWQTINGGSPNDVRELDYLFRTPEVAFGGEETHAASIAWGASFPGAKPAYLPTTNYSWEATGYIYVTLGGVYSIGVDCSDAGEIMVDGLTVATWLGSHATAGGATPDFEAHSGTIRLHRGYHQVRIRMEARTTAGAIAVGWRPPGSSWQTIPAGNFSTTAGSRSSPPTGTLRVRWFNTALYITSITVTAATTEQIRRSLAWAVTAGQYDVRLRRVTQDSTDANVIDAAVWTSLRTIRSDDPLKIPGVAKIAMRIKATDQLNGFIDDFNCMAHSVHWDWDPAIGEWIERATSTPASCYRAVLQGAANRRPMADDRLDLAEFQDWAVDTRAKGLECNCVMDFAGTVWERLADIAAAGRARPAMRDGLYSIVRDRIQTVPVQMFTPRNSWGFKGRKVFAELPHGLRVQFLNEATGYQRDERVVLADGYTIDGRDAFGNLRPELPAATLFEPLEVFGVVTSTEAFIHGRYHHAQARLRPEVFELSTDFEHLACNAGDLVLVGHDVPQWGQGAGRILDLVVDSDDNLRGLVLDEPVIMDAGLAYVVRVRLEDLTTFIRAVVTEEGQQKTLMFVGLAGPNTPRPKRGDLFAFGRLDRETVALVIRSIEPAPDLSARLTFVNHAPEVLDADEGEIPDYDPGIDGPPAWQNRPETPVIESIRSDDLVMLRGADGSLQPRMLLALRTPSTRRPFPSFAVARTRVVPDPPAEPTPTWTTHPMTPLTNSQLYVNGVEEGLTYDVRVRTVTAIGQASDWSAIVRHTIVGKSRPPPDVDEFDVQRLSDGTREYTWDLVEVPPDLAGFSIRYGETTADWSEMLKLHDGLLDASPAELNEPPAGTWRFGIKAVDTSGNESLNATYVIRTLGPPRVEGVAFRQDEYSNGWPGIRTNCFIAGDVLEAVDRATWDSLGSYGVTTWNGYFRWNVDPVSPIQYENTLDAGIDFDFSPDAEASADGDLWIELVWSTDGLAWTDWKRVEDVRGRVVRARYLKCRLTCWATEGYRVPVIRSLVIYMRAKQIVHEHQDLTTNFLHAPMWRYGVGDVRLPLPVGVFRIVRNVQLSFNGMGAGWSWELVDRLPYPGPRVRIYNADHQLADAVIDAIIRGYGGDPGVELVLAGGLWLAFNRPENAVGVALL